MTDGHMHLEYGPLNTEYVCRFIDTAVEKGFTHIQILDHTHRFKEFEPAYEELKKIPQQKEWLENRKMKFAASLDEYIRLIDTMKKMSLPIEVKFGLEVCYTEGTEDFIRNLLKNYSFDFLVGAVHSVDGLLYDMSAFSREILWDVWDINDIYRRYYDSVIKCAKSGIFTQLAHPDTIKMWNKYPEYDLTGTYEELADAVLKNGMLAECNTGCTYRYGHKDIGLSDELLDVFLKKGVPLITASDAHHPEDVGSFIPEAVKHIEERKLLLQ